MKRTLSSLPFVIIFLGISFLLYPTISNRINERTQSIAIAGYEASTRSLETGQRQKLWEDAVRYNEKLIGQYGRFTPSKEELQTYNALLDISQTGIMGSIKIPKIHVDFPIYHGIEESTLQVAVGHLPGSSLPVGGPGTHCVLSGHSGLPSARLLTDLDQLEPGDQFAITVLNETLLYEVDQIVTVLPNDLHALEIEPEKDFCTLLTCTPYGVNTHRLLVRGHRIPENDAAEALLRENTAQHGFPWFPGVLLLGGIALLLAVMVSLHKRRAHKTPDADHTDRRGANKKGKKKR